MSKHNSRTKQHRYSFELKQKSKPKIIEKLTTDLFISATCTVEEANNICYEIAHKNVEALTTLQHGGLLFPFNSIPQNHPDNFKTKDYKSFNYTDHETNAATFGYRRNPGMRIHAARDLYSDVGEPIYAIADGIVLASENFYMKTDVVVIEHEFETELAKGFKMVVRYGEVDKKTIKVNVGDRVCRGEKIAEVGQLIRHDGTNFQQPSGENRGMLHIEFYTGEVSTTFKPGYVNPDDMLHAKSDNFSVGRSFKRRIDLFDPLDLLDEMLETSKTENRIQ